MTSPKPTEQMIRDAQKVIPEYQPRTHPRLYSIYEARELYLAGALAERAKSERLVEALESSHEIVHSVCCKEHACVVGCEEIDKALRAFEEHEKK